MSKLVQNCTAAERMRGCTFAETFKDSSSIALNGGTISGTPIVKDGINLNGTTDRVLYQSLGREVQPTISIVVEFVPDFATTEDATRYIIDSSGPASGRIIIRKDNNAASNTLRLYLGQTNLIEAIAEATYSPYWYVGKRNVIVVSSISGATNMWLNGIQLLTNDTTAFTYDSITSLYVGSTNSGTSFFDGRILSLKVFNTLLTAQEALDIYNNTTYEYMNNAIINLPCTHEMHDPTNSKALDMCNNYDATITGATKLSTRGYEIAASGTELLSFGDVTELNSASSFTISFLFDPQVVLMSDTGYFIMKLIDSSTDLRIYQSVLGFICRITGTHGLFNIVDNVTNNVGISFVFDGSGAANADRLKGYLNGREVALSYTGTIPATTYDLVTKPLTIGYGATGLHSYMKHFILHQEPLTPTQVADLHISLLKELNYNG